MHIKAVLQKSIQKPREFKQFAKVHIIRKNVSDFRKYISTTRNSQHWCLMSAS